MLRMRLQRRGKRNYATYRVVVAEQRAPVKGRFMADLGFYNPHTDAFEVKKEAAQEWLSKGVKPSATVHNLLVTHGLIKADKVTSWRPKVKKVEEPAANTHQQGGQAAGEEKKKPEEEKKDDTDSK